MGDLRPGRPDMEASAATRWSVAFAAAVMNGVQTGAFFMTPTTLMPEIVADFGLKLSLSTVPIAVGKIAYVLLLIPGGMVVDHFGPRRCVLAGLLGIALLITFYSTVVTSFSSMLVLHVLLATSASISGVPIYSIFIAQWFHSGIGLAMGLVLAGYSAAGTLVPAFLGPIANDFGWRIAMACMACVLWFVGLPIAYFFLHENHDTDELRALSVSSVRVTTPMRGSPASGPHPNESTPLVAPQQTKRDVILENKSWTFAGFALSYILLQYCFGCFGENIMFFLHTDCKISLATASLYFSALNFSSFIAKLIGGHLGDRFDRFHVAAATSGLAGVGIMTLFCTPRGVDEHYIPYLTGSHITILIFVVLFGFGYGATFNSLYALVPIVFGRKNLGTTQSTLFGLGLAGNAVGSVLTGVLREKYGTYQRPFLVAAVACIANFFTFNITRITLGGSLRGMKAVAEGPTPQPYQRMEELEAHAAREKAVMQRIGAFSDGGTPRRSPLGSAPNILGSGFFGAAFAPSPSSERLFAGMSPSAGYAGGIPLTLPVSELELAASLAAKSGDNEEDGIQAVEGFPIARDWSSGSLRRAQRRTMTVDPESRLPPASPRVGSIRRSSTAESIIRSGVLSASMEAPGYLGHAQSAEDVVRPRSYSSLDPRSPRSNRVCRDSVTPQ